MQPKAQRRKDPRGGLTASGRKYFREKEGSQLKPGVRGPADTPEKQRRKGSFLRRMFTHPRGPMMKDGKPTRLALSAHAWGEPVPRTMAAAKRLAKKGEALLAKYAKGAKKPHGKPSPRKTTKNSLVGNINKRKHAGKSRPKIRTTISKKAYKEMESGWPRSRRKTALKTHAGRRKA